MQCCSGIYPGLGVSGLDACSGVLLRQALTGFHGELSQQFSINHLVASISDEGLTRVRETGDNSGVSIGFYGALGG